MFTSENSAKTTVNTTAEMKVSNSSGDSETIYNLSYELWAIYESCSIVLITLSLYIFLVLVRFTCIKSHHFSFFFGNFSDKMFPIAEMELVGNKNGSVVQRQSKKSLREGTKKRRHGGTNTSAAALRILCLLGALFALVRLSSDQLELATYGGPRINCKIYQVMVICTYALSATCIYTALWVRLRVFFYHPIMKHLTSPTVIFFIWLGLICILASSILNTVIFIVTVQANDSTNGCVLGETISVSPTARYIILTASTVTSQGILLSLFLYPLMKHRLKIKSLSSQKTARIPFSVGNGGNRPSFVRIQMEPIIVNGSLKDGNMMSFQLSKKIRREKRLLSIIMRVLITAVVCVLSDVVAAVTTILLNNHPRVVTNMVFNLNLLINLISVLFSFGDWSERLIPFCAKKKKHRHYENTQVRVSSIIIKNSQQEVSCDDRKAYSKESTNHPINKAEVANKKFLSVRETLEMVKNEDTITSIGKDEF